MWQGGPNGKIWPPVAETFNGFPSGDVERVTIGLVDLCQCFNQIRCVAFVAAKSSPNRVGVNCYSQVACGPRKSGYELVQREVNLDGDVNELTSRSSSSHFWRNGKIDLRRFSEGSRLSAAYFLPAADA
jgi:hypothetical protein